MTARRGAGVVGGGLMGTGIVHALLLAGADVILVEVSGEAGDRAAAKVLADLRRSEKRGSGQAADELFGRLTVATDLSALAGVELVVEAVPEDLAVKLEVLGDIERVVGETVVLATNTSSVSIKELAAGLKRPERLVGMHFFNPVPASSLVELVAGETADEVISTARDWVDRMDKTAIVVRDSPGFASSRLGVALGLEAIRMVEEGVASAEDIDAAMVLGYKHPVGPLRLTDLVGVDVRLGIARYLAERLGPRFSPPRLMREMVDRGDLGRKSGRGFYTWSRPDDAA